MLKKKLLSLILVTALILCGSVSGCRFMVNAERKSGVADSGEDLEDEDVDEDEDEAGAGEGDEHVGLSEDESLEVTYRITSKGSGRGNVDVTLQNITGDRISDWAVCIVLSEKVEKIWNARITDKKEGEWIVVENASGDQNIEGDGTVTFGMTVCYEDEIGPLQGFYLIRDKVEVGEKDYSVQYTENSREGDLVNATIKITNSSTERIEDWKFTYHVTNKINSFEDIQNAELIRLYEHSMVQVDNLKYNRNIEPGQSVEFSFAVSCKGDLKIENFTLYKMREIDYKEGHYPYETNSPWSKYWEPACDPDDFETDEEYEQYLKENGYTFFVYEKEELQGELDEFLTAESTLLSVKYPAGRISAKVMSSFLWTMINCLRYSEE